MILEHLGKKLLFLDGGMGTQLQARGLRLGEFPEVWNMEHREEVQEIHKSYLKAGSRIVLTNTFGANKVKWDHPQYSSEEVVRQAVKNAKSAASEMSTPEEKCYVALDIGSTGKLLEPVGNLSFDEAYEAFKEMVLVADKEGVDLVCIETMSDTYEVKAAVLAVKENSNLPVFVTLMFDEKGTLLTGCDIAGCVALLEGLRVDAIGMNCGLGPKQMLPLLKEMRKHTSLPIIVKPNAGLPVHRDGQTCYDVEPEEFATCVKELVCAGASVVGGCCGTTPAHIEEMVKACADMALSKPEEKTETVVSSYNHTVFVGDDPIIIGERINPTGKKRFKEALKSVDYGYILNEGFQQQDAGAHILDVNVGLPDIDEPAMMKETVKVLQANISLPLQIDTVNVKALEAGMRYYNGKPMVNSVNGKQESMDAVFPLVKKYGGVVVGLTLDEQGIPETAKGRLEIAKKIVLEAEKYGIDKKDIVIDVLTLTISSEPESGKVTLDALRMVREELGVKTVLGVSNISFGLPNRQVINSYFYTMALQAGLSAGIINPLSQKMMESYHSYRALMHFDCNCEKYMSFCSNTPNENVQSQKEEKETLYLSIVKGREDSAEKLTKELLKDSEPLSIIQTELIPALDEVGKGFEQGTLFLPQLLMSAEAAKKAFEVIKIRMEEQGEKTTSKGKIILATVKGDIHDIGKNIVKVLLENYGYQVLDLGKDVAPELIVETAREENVTLIGLSALMTTTVVSMEETIKLVREHLPECKVIVGGAVLNQEYADMIGADFYAKDAMQTVAYAQNHVF